MRVISNRALKQIFTVVKNYVDNMPLLKGFRREHSCLYGTSYMADKLVLAESIQDYREQGGPYFACQAGIAYTQTNKSSVPILYLMAAAGPNTPVHGYVEIQSSSISGGADNLFSCGYSAKAWKNIYCNSSTIITSDRNYKTDIQNLPDKYIQLFSKLIPVSYKFKDFGSNGRTHIGLISQDVETAMEELDISPQEFAGFCKDQLMDEDDNPSFDEEGNPQYKYALRYEEFIALNTAVIQKQQSKINELEHRIEALEQLVKNGIKSDVE